MQFAFFDVACFVIVKFEAEVPAVDAPNYVSLTHVIRLLPIPKVFLPAMSAIAREAGALLLHLFSPGIKIEYKGDADLVTAADRASETLIRERISKQFPSHDVLGEEQGLNDQGGDYRWYVDPLDGTTNFAHGYPVFCVSMALEHRALEGGTREQGAASRAWSTIRRAMNCSRRSREEARTSTGSRFTCRRRRS